MADLVSTVVHGTLDTGTVNRAIEDTYLETLWVGNLKGTDSTQTITLSESLDNFEYLLVEAAAGPVTTTYVNRVQYQIPVAYLDTNRVWRSVDRGGDGFSAIEIWDFWKNGGNLNVRSVANLGNNNYVYKVLGKRKRGDQLNLNILMNTMTRVTASTVLTLSESYAGYEFLIAEVRPAGTTDTGNWRRQHILIPVSYLDAGLGGGWHGLSMGGSGYDQVEIWGFAKNGTSTTTLQCGNIADRGGNNYIERIYGWKPRTGIRDITDIKDSSGKIQVTSWWKTISIEEDLFNFEYIVVGVEPATGTNWRTNELLIPTDYLRTGMPWRGLSQGGDAFSAIEFWEIHYAPLQGMLRMQNSNNAGSNNYITGIHGLNRQ